MRTYDETVELQKNLWAHFSMICTAGEDRVYKTNQGGLKADPLLRWNEIRFGISLGEKKNKR